MKAIKISDTTQEITQGSRADLYWKENPYKKYFQAFRPGLIFEKDLAFGNNVEKVLEKFNIKALGFGQWVTIEDRLNYVNALIIACYDLNKVLRFNQNIGISKNLSIAFGARGANRAIAHYEPWSNNINLTRYHKGPERKIERLLTTGGMGSLTHEYGHFLDFFAGSYLDKNIEFTSLTNGRSTARGRVGVAGPIRTIMDDLMEKVIWKTPGKEYSPYYKRLMEIYEHKPGMGEYFIRRTEIFARAFEVFVCEELKKQGIENKFLVHTWYDQAYYIKPGEMQAISPIFKKLIDAIRKYIV